jgi:ABC-type sugar transport system permease subunit
MWEVQMWEVRQKNLMWNLTFKAKITINTMKQYFLSHIAVAALGQYVALAVYQKLWYKKWLIAVILIAVYLSAILYVVRTNSANNET